MRTLSLIADKLLAAKTIMIYPHINIDGDAIGSSHALCDSLIRLGKSANIVYKGDIPVNYDFMSTHVIPDTSGIESIDVSIMLDCGAPNRIADNIDDFDRGRVKLCVDHHITSSESIDWDAKYTEPTASSCCELIIKLLDEMGCEISAEAANALYAGISTDTGSFQHANIKRDTFAAVCRLFEVKDFSPAETARLVYKRKSVGQVKLVSEFLNRMKLYNGDTVATGIMTEDMIASNNCTVEDAGDMVSKLMTINTVEVAATFKEDGDSVRISLRSKGKYNVRTFAEKYGGGGHNLASGTTLKGDFDEIVDEITKALIEEFK